MTNKAKENLNNKKISQFLTIVKEQIIDKKWSIFDREGNKKNAERVNPTRL